MSEQWAVHNTVVKNINDLIEYDSNPREHTPEQVEQVANSIREFGWTMPILIDETNEIIAGHGRLMAGKKLGIKEVPCIVAQGWSDEQKKAYCIADNKLTENSTWSKDFLKLNLTSLYDDEFDLKLTGFSDDELSKLLPDFNIDEGLTDEDDVPTPPEEPVTKLGDVWLCGEHRVMCGDSTNDSEVALLMNGVNADMVFTDPPYGISYDPKSSKHETIKNDDVFLEDWIPLVDKYSQGFIFMWTGYQVVGKWLNITTQFGEITNMVIWSKGGGGLGDLYKRFSTDFEIALVWNRGEKLKDKRIGSVWEIKKDSSNAYVHPTQKPVELIEKALINCSKLKNLVLDLFLGSGSTLIACQKRGRKCYGMELDSKYCDVIVKRWQNYTGEEATLESDGAKFNDLLK